MNKIIFLDIDGVLNCSRSKLDRSFGYLGIDDDKIARLKHIVNKTNAKIVLVSSWKDDWFPDLSWKNMQGKFGNLIDKKMLENQLKIITKTDDEGYNRGEGIKNYIDNNKVDSFVILDDEIFEDYETYNLLDHLINTDFYNGGLTDKCAENAIRILNNVKAQRKCIGAIGGDIVGSQFEFNAKPSNIKFEKFSKLCKFTDDTVLTMALMDYFNNDKKNSLPFYLKKWFFKYPDAGFGSMFYEWCATENSKPYYSFGNGSAMRISPVAYIAKDLDECLKLAKETAEVTHNHPEGIKGAQAIAGCIFLAKNGFKEEVFNFAKKYYSNIDKLDLKKLHDNYEFDVTCQGSVPIAIFAFLASSSYLNCLELVNYIGGDCDTIGAMAGAIAEAYYGINRETEEDIIKYLPNDLINVIDNFNNKYIKED